MEERAISYDDFLMRKSHSIDFDGVPEERQILPDTLFDFQRHLVSWAIQKGRSALFCDCGLGKTFMELVFADNICRATNEKVLIITPLAVSHQFVSEGERFGIPCQKSSNGKPKGDITVTNYERLHLFDPEDYMGVVCDESSAIKNFEGARRKIVTEFLKKKRYRLLATATPSPNDYIELGTTSEALGELGYMDMLQRFFKNDQNTMDTKRKWAMHGGDAPKWRFKKHAQDPFWKWICSWARAMRKPSDIGFDDGPFILPNLIEQQTVILNKKPRPGEMWVRPAVGLAEQRVELRETLQERCEKVAEIISGVNGPSVAWCHLNDEGDLLEKMISGAVQVSGKDSDERKEEILAAFSQGEIAVLVTKPKIASFGMNWQHCNHTTFFPSHSFEQYYQSVRRFWRFGQKNPVTVDIVTTQGGEQVLKNLQRKSKAAEEMFESLVKYMNDSMGIDKRRQFTKTVKIPSFLN